MTRPTPWLAETSLTYSAIVFAGWGTFVYLAGHISEADDGWSCGIKAGDVPQGIGPFVFIETGQPAPAHVVKNHYR